MNAIKKTKSKRLISMLLVLMMVLTLLSAAVSAVGTNTDKAIMMGISGISGPITTTNANGNDYTPSDYIYFGVNGSEPIKWRVLSTSGNATGNSDSLSDGTNTVNNSDALFLLSEYLLGSNVEFNSHYTKGNAWQESDAQTWAKDFATGNSAAFSSGEQVALLATTKEDASTSKYSIAWGTSKLDGDKVFFLSADELSQYVGSYNYAPGLKATPTGITHAGVWWLRSPYYNHSHYAGVVSVIGNVGYNGVNVGWAVRPAFNLDLNSVLFTSAAVGGKISSAAGGKAIFEIPEYTGEDWKVTMLDSTRSFTARKTAKEGDKLTVEYSGAVTGENEYISVLIADSAGAYTHYGRVAQLDGTTNKAEGTVEIDLSDIDMTDKKLYVFNEKYNGGAADDTKLTDYASALITVSFTVTFNKNGHGTAPAAVTAFDGDKLAEPAAAPTEKGYIFGGWYKDSECTAAWDFAVDTVTADITLYAKWTECDHSGNTTEPSHTDVTYCSVCGGDIAAIGHTYDRENAAAQYLKSHADCTNPAVYYKSCSCGVSSEGETGETFTSGSPTGHADTTPKDHICDNGCGKDDVGTHEQAAGKHTCDYCNAKMSDCSGGTATCTQKAICEVCGNEYGNLLAHKYSTAWKFDKDNHLHECTRCGDKKDAAAHTWNYDAATEEHDKHCTVCGYVAQAQHANSSPKTGDNSNMLLWIALLLTSCGGIVTTVVVKRKRVRSK